MNGSALNYGLISTEVIKQSLVIARGDLFLASCYLDVKPKELDSHIRSSQELQHFVTSIEKVKQDSEYNKLSNDQFADQLENLTRAYRVEATEVIHELAMMPFDTAAMAEVKLKAAIALRGQHHEAAISNNSANVLAELNTLYQQAAPRIKSVRIAQIEFKQEGEL